MVLLTLLFCLLLALGFFGPAIIELIRYERLVCRRERQFKEDWLEEYRRFSEWYTQNLRRNEEYDGEEEDKRGT